MASVWLHSASPLNAKDSLLCDDLLFIAVWCMPNTYCSVYFAVHRGICCVWEIPCPVCMLMSVVACRVRNSRCFILGCPSWHASANCLVSDREEVLGLDHVWKWCILPPYKAKSKSSHKSAIQSKFIAIPKHMASCRKDFQTSWISIAKESYEVRRSKDNFQSSHGLVLVDCL